MEAYLQMLRAILREGVRKPTRAKLESTGEHVDAISVFGYQTRYDLRAGFPLLTTKRVWFHGVKHELIWMLRGDTNIRYLHENDVHIWDQWVDANGDIGPGYGAQWVRWCSVDRAHPGNTKETNQISDIISGIRAVRLDPTASVGRRLILTAWNVGDIADMKLPPCHTLSQFMVTGGKLSCHLYQRSADAFLGVPFNIAQYALLTHLFAHLTGLDVGELVHSFGDLHVYVNHVEQVQEQLQRAPSNLPTLGIDPALKDISALQGSMIDVVGYSPMAALRGEVAI